MRNIHENTLNFKLKYNVNLKLFHSSFLYLNKTIFFQNIVNKPWQFGFKLSSENLFTSHQMSYLYLNTTGNGQEILCLNWTFSRLLRPDICFAKDQITAKWSKHLIFVVGYNK